MSKMVIGIDLGDKRNYACALNYKGDVVDLCSIRNTADAIRKYLSNYNNNKDDMLVVMEAGTHSPWISRLIDQLGFTVMVGNPRKMRSIWAHELKTDARDAQMLARIGLFDTKLLYPINHRGIEAQAHLAIIKARDVLVRTRSALINHVRASVKSWGDRIPRCSAECFHKRVVDRIADALLPALEPIIGQIHQLTEQIRIYDTQIATLCAEVYPETGLLQQISGVGPLTSLTFVLTIENVDRFRKSRTVGAYLGLTPKIDQSGDSNKQLGLSKAGDRYLRRLLVGSAHFIMGPFGRDCELRRFGERLCERGGKNAKRRAVVAVARKLATKMHCIWRTGEIYNAFYNSGEKEAA